MSWKASAAKSALYAIAGLAAVSLGGCGGFDGVQLNGKIFDAVGLSGGGPATGEPKLAQRSIVVPPSTASLPAPGLQPDGAAADVAALQDPDKVASVSQADQQRAQEAYCNKNYVEAKQRGDDNADLATGPLGPCRGSVLTGLQSWQKGDAADDDDQTQQ